uniref:Uncharacterized protein n=1 Tax=Anguilla anguilla TaxID=7936 RepID=A0A0E9RG72_ANGAN
MLLDRGRGGTS